MSTRSGAGHGAKDFDLTRGSAMFNIAIPCVRSRFFDIIQMISSLTHPSRSKSRFLGQSRFFRSEFFFRRIIVGRASGRRRPPTSPATNERAVLATLTRIVWSGRSLTLRRSAPTKYIYEEEEEQAGWPSWANGERIVFLSPIFGESGSFLRSESRYLLYQIPSLCSI